MIPRSVFWITQSFLALSLSCRVKVRSLNLSADAFAVSGERRSILTLVRVKGSPFECIHLYYKVSLSNLSELLILFFLIDFFFKLVESLTSYFVRIYHSVTSMNVHIFGNGCRTFCKFYSYRSVVVYIEHIRI